MNEKRAVGRYELKKWLASGAMGDVYHAHDPVIDRPVAIKLLRRELSQGSAAQEWLQRFTREARAAGSRFHPNIVAVLDFGEHEGMPFLAMEFVEGENLDARLKKAGALSLDLAISIITQVLDALTFAHDNGVVHRDIKPANVIVLDNGHVKVADFGVAHIDTSELTIVGDVLGTPAYMAPEQLSGSEVDHRADLFATGVMFFELLTGVKPFRGKSITDIIAHIEKRGPEDVCVLNPDVPPSLKPVISQALAFKIEDRFASAAEFSKSIADALSTHSRTVVTHSEVVPAPTPEPHPTGQPVADTRWTDEMLREIERELAALIGPLATVAVRRSTRTAANLGMLYENLAKYIDQEAERTTFLASGRRRAVTLSPSGSHRRTMTPTASVSGPQPPSSIPAEEIAEVTKSLAEFVGPIARVLVRQHLSRSSTAAELRLDLSTFIADDADRAIFLRTQKRR